MLAVRMVANERLTFARTAWLTDHSFEAGAGATGEMNAEATAGNLGEEMGRHAALSFASTCMNEVYEENVKPA